MNTIVNQHGIPSDTADSPAASPVRRSSLRNASVALVVALLGTLGVAAAAPGSASAATGPSSGNAPFVMNSGCNYHTALAAGPEGFYTQFWTYDATHGGWSAGPWYYTQGAANWEYNTRAGWLTGSGIFQAPPSGSTTYVWAWTYSESQGWRGYKMGRCYNGSAYAGW